MPTPVARYASRLASVMVGPSRFYRQLDVAGRNGGARRHLFVTLALAATLHLAVMLIGEMAIDRTPLSRRVVMPAIALWLTVFAVLVAMTYIEMLGVTAFSRRRGWRVPFRLAERVCAFASAGWLPGVVIAGVGTWVLGVHGQGRPWFEQLIGLVRVGWLCYAALFVASFLWFETLVWIGVRRVKFANAWPDRDAGEPPPGKPSPHGRQPPPDL
ncbi:MAG: hypothetical protein ACPGYV_13300 [Phycisphaeraceae bacterium]